MKMSIEEKNLNADSKARCPNANSKELSQSDSKAENEMIKKQFGVSSKEILLSIIKQALKGFPYYISKEMKSLEELLLLVKDMNPSDAVEAKLCAKEAAMYSLAMQYVHRAEAGMFSEDSDMGGRMWYETNMNYAIKLLRLHNETVETLSRYRRKGEQKVTVQHQHVQVNDGGKAIVNGKLMAGGESN